MAACMDNLSAGPVTATLTFLPDLGRLRSLRVQLHHPHMSWYRHGLGDAPPTRGLWSYSHTKAMVMPGLWEDRAVNRNEAPHLWSLRLGCKKFLQLSDVTQ